MPISIWRRWASTCGAVLRLIKKITTPPAQFKAANGAAYQTFAGNDTLNAVPEPVSIATFGLGAGAMVLIRRRRRKSA
ncbi:MAG: PEP-CTERM sorting domain-containing protein [Massilia sp.]|jgi:hypothetical protein